MGGEADQVLWRGVRPVEGIRGVWPARNAARINKSGFQSGVGSELIYNVPADKKLFIASAWMGTRLSLAASSSVFLYARDTAHVTLYYMFFHLYDIAGQMSDFRLYIPGLEVEADGDVLIYCDHANLDTRGGLSGWLEDA